MSKGSGYIMLDKYLAQEFKSIRREFSIIEAMFSYTLDQDKGLKGSIKGYSALWGWSRNRVRRFIKLIRTVKGHPGDTRRTPYGHPLHFIDKALWVDKDSQGTVKGHPKDTQRTPTINPIILNPKSKEKKKIKKKSFSVYLQDRIISNNFIESKDVIFEFYKYRQSMPSVKKYKSEKGINGLFRDLNGCRKAGLIISECLEISMERGWLTPDPTYFKNNGFEKKKTIPGTTMTKEEYKDFING